MPPLISSFDLNLLIALRRLQQDPVCPLGYIIREFKDDALEMAIQYGFETLNCDYRSLNHSAILKANMHHIAILPYTVNDPIIGQGLLEQGVTAIFSNYPNLLKERCQ
jgi:glycerophosphoryl diester phosphodiesterase